MDIARSRKMGTYYMAVLLFKTYFKVCLCRNQSRKHNSHLAPNSSSPRRSARTSSREFRRLSCRRSGCIQKLTRYGGSVPAYDILVLTRSSKVAYNYYLGVFAFLREDYVEAEAKFLASLEMIHRTSHKNIE